MRIRKNARLPQMLQQSHVCQLNQSPWDVIHFGHPSDLLELENSFTESGSPGDSIGAVKSVASMMHGSTKLEDLSIRNEEEMKKDEDKESDDNGGKEITELEKRTKKKLYSQKNGGKGWRCKKEAREDHSFFDYYHFNLLRSYNISVEPPSGGRPTRATRAAKKWASGSSKPDEFYYYSGFGPSRGKRRGDRGGTDESKIADEEAGNQSNITSASSPETDSQKFDYIDEEDDEDDEDDNNGDHGKKRKRKPVKARSLKSLM